MCVFCFFFLGILSVFVNIESLFCDVLQRAKLFWEVCDYICIRYCTFVNMDMKNLYSPSYPSYCSHFRSLQPPSLSKLIWKERFHRTWDSTILFFSQNTLSPLVRCTADSIVSVVCLYSVTDIKHHNFFFGRVTKVKVFFVKAHFFCIFAFMQKKSVGARHVCPNVRSEPQSAEVHPISLLWN